MSGDCKFCIHRDACESWVRYINTVYDEYDYSVTDCPYFKKDLESEGGTND